MLRAAPYIPASFPSSARANFVPRHAWNAYFTKYSLTASVRIEPAFETPPPITNISGSTTHAICARVLPRICAC